MENGRTKPDINQTEEAGKINRKYKKCGDGDFCSLMLCCLLPSMYGDFDMGDPAKAEAKNVSENCSENFVF